jgi:Fe-S oxidoreductase
VEPDLVVGCDTSCLMHLQTRSDAVGTPVHVRHLAELLAAALPAEAEDGR